jgi:hypothetical protein
MFLIGAVMLVHAIHQENTIPVLERDIVGVGNEKMASALLMIIPIGIGFGLSSGTGRPYGGRQYKGLGGY